MVGHEVLAEGNSMALAAGSAKAGFRLRPTAPIT